MIVAEIKNPTVTVRIHDDFFDTAHQARINRISQIVTDHYKRRQADMKRDTPLNLFRRKLSGLRKCLRCTPITKVLN